MIAQITGKIKNSQWNQQHSTYMNRSKSN